jgi:hypothetical protein
MVLVAGLWLLVLSGFRCQVSGVRDQGSKAQGSRFWLIVVGLWSLVSRFSMLECWIFDAF